MTKVLQVTKYFFPYIGGIEQTSRDIVNSLTCDDTEIKTICFNESAEADGYVCKREKTVHDIVDGKEIIRCGCIAKIASQPISGSFSRELKQLIQKFEPNIVIFNYPNPFAAHFLLKHRKREFKLIVWWHLDITRQKILGKMFHNQNIRLLERADIVIATSPNYIVGSQYLNKFKDNCRVIPSCINTGRFSVVDIEKIKSMRQENNGKTVCVGVGRHVLYKGYKYLIEAAKYLDNSFKIYIGGSGPLTDELKEQAKGLENVEFLGRISDSELATYLTVCDIFCFPSITRNEAFGLALAEGMYFGKPAVTFTIPGSGVNYVNLDGVTGIECPNGDSKAYAKALKILADNPELREKYGKAARQRVLENFTDVIFKKNLKNIINDLKKDKEHAL